MSKRVAVICSYPIPEGMAATTRIMAYSKGMVKNGYSVDVFSYVPSGEAYNNSNKDQGFFENVFYCYPLRRERFKNKFLHKVESVFSIGQTLKVIRNRHSDNSYDALIISNDNPLILFLFSKFSKKINSKCIFIFDEYPIPIRKFLKEKIPYFKTMAYKYSLKNVDGYISMTYSLVNFYNKIAAKPFFLISSLTDLDRFLTSEKTIPLPVKKITYMGNMELSKDNVDNIIEGFAFLAEQKKDINLYLYGNPSSRDKKILDKLIAELNLKSRVYFGFAQYDEVPQILASSHILVSSQPNSKRAQGGFPTKLGEYLATGVPVLLTDVGEISKFVSDKKEVFFSKPEDSIEFGKKLLYIYNNYTFAKNVGNDGKKLVENNYSHLTAGRGIINFINKIKE